MGKYKYTFRNSIVVLMLFVGISAFSQQIFDPFDFGAKGDGKAVDTKAIQSTIDKSYENGGGKVYLHNGCFVSGTIYLKSNVTLEIENGSTLKASNDLTDFPTIESKYPSYIGEMKTNKMLIYAEDASNIKICGSGTIDGNGDYWVDGPYGSPSFSVRPRIIHFRTCKNVQVTNVTLYNSASWVQSYQSCKNVLISGVIVDSRPNKDIEKSRFEDAPGRNCDGLDLIDCQQVRISDCNINSGDDAICLKSFSPDESCQDIVISNCIVSSNASGIKIGTETAGTIRDIVINNCVVYNTRCDALSIMTADGAQIERVNMSNISVRNIKGTAIFIRLGKRMRPYRNNVKLNQPYLKDITINNIVGSGIESIYCCSLTGLPDALVENIKLKDIQLEIVGGKTLSESSCIVPEKEKSYPYGRMFGSLPAYGFYIRHAKNVSLENLTTRFKNEDQRPALWCDDVEHLVVKGLSAEASDQTTELIRLIDVRDAIISESQPLNFVQMFISLYGNETEQVVLKDNFLRRAELSISPEKNYDESIFSEIGTIK